MRIWDISVKRLCDKHLRGEHLELHSIWTIITQNRKGYRNHPELKRWRGKLLALYNRHNAQVEEMTRRGWNHQSPLNILMVSDMCIVQDEQWQTTEKQIAILKEKGCDCKV